MTRKNHNLNDYSHINGISRNVVVRLSKDELEAMASEVSSVRRNDGRDHYKRRLEYVKRRDEMKK